MLKASFELFIKAGTNWHFSTARKLSPNPPKRQVVVEKDEGISDEEDTAELKLQLELNEQVRMTKQKH